VNKRRKIKVGLNFKVNYVSLLIFHDSSFNSQDEPIVCPSRPAPNALKGETEHVDTEDVDTEDLEKTSQRGTGRKKRTSKVGLKLIVFFINLS